MFDTTQMVEHPFGCCFCCPGVTIASFKGERKALSKVDPTKHAFGAGLDDSGAIGGLD
jgi:hypothetical protein